MQYLRFVTSLLALVPVSAAHNYRRCGDSQPSEDFKIQSANVDESRFSSPAAINIKTFVHVVTTEAKKGKYSLSQVWKQIDVLNYAYRKTGITFKLATTDFTVNDNWATTENFQRPDIKMKNQLHMGTYADLNLYFLSDLANNTGLLGYCPFPETNIHPKNATSAQEFYIRHDGCLLLADSMPGGDAEPFNLGATAPHEVGHYLGLFHVFNGNKCTGVGDGIADTPPQKLATSGCPKFQNSCKGGGPDSIHNYMDYSDDRCLNQFTPDQARKARSNYNRFRACNGACS